MNKKDDDGNTPLGVAADQGKKDIAELLISKGADVNYKNTNNWDTTPLRRAVERGDKSMAELLISKGADVNAYGQYGTPLHDAARKGRKDIAELLITKGANLNAKDESENTPLYWAVKGGKSEMVALLQQALARQAGGNMKYFEDLISDLNQNPNDSYKRRAVCEYAGKMKPAPAIPEGAKKALLRGEALFEAARKPDDYSDAIKEFDNALGFAPWWSSPYYDKGLAYEAMREYDDGKISLGTTSSPPRMQTTWRL